MKFPLEAHINPPMWIYLHIIAVKFVLFYCNKIKILHGCLLALVQQTSVEVDSFLQEVIPSVLFLNV